MFVVQFGDFRLIGLEMMFQHIVDVTEQRNFSFADTIGYALNPFVVFLTYINRFTYSCRNDRFFQKTGSITFLLVSSAIRLSCFLFILNQIFKLFFIQFLNFVFVLFQMTGKDGIYISADGYLLIGDDIHDSGNLVVYFPADIDALTCFNLIAFEERLRIIGVLPFAATALSWRFRYGLVRLRLRSGCRRLYLYATVLLTSADGIQQQSFIYSFRSCFATAHAYQIFMMVQISSASSLMLLPFIKALSIGKIVERKIALRSSDKSRRNRLLSGSRVSSTGIFSSSII